MMIFGRTGESRTQRSCYHRHKIQTQYCMLFHNSSFLCAYPLSCPKPFLYCVRVSRYPGTAVSGYAFLKKGGNPATGAGNISENVWVRVWNEYPTGYNSNVRAPGNMDTFLVWFGFKAYGIA